MTTPSAIDLRPPGARGRHSSVGSGRRGRHFPCIGKSCTVQQSATLPGRLDQTIRRLDGRFGIKPKSVAIWAAAVVYALLLGWLAAIGQTWTAFVMVAAVVALAGFY